MIPRLATTGVTLTTPAQGQGYAADAVAWLLDYLFLDRRKHRVTADCDVPNGGAVALLDHATQPERGEDGRMCAPLAMSIILDRRDADPSR